MSETAADTVARFAADLRELRHVGGHPTLRSLSAHTGISKSVLSEAFAGRRLPTANTVRRLAVLFESDPRVWVERRDALARAARTPVRPAAPVRRGRGRATWVAAAAVALVTVATVAASAGSSMMASRGTDVPSPLSLDFSRVLPDIPPINGANPLRTDCAADASPVRSEVIADGLISVSLVASTRCRAVWGVAALLNAGSRAVAPPGVISLEIYPANDRFGGQARRALETGETSYTRMLVAPVIDDGVCLSVTLTRSDGGESTFDSAVCADASALR